MKLLKSCLLESVYDWILDNQNTPYIMVDTTSETVSVPREYVQDDRIVLNIHPRSVDGFIVNDEGLSFLARFNGQSRPVVVPYESLIALYARETSQGLVFQGETVATELVSNLLPVSTEPPQQMRPQLRIVK